MNRPTLVVPAALYGACWTHARQVNAEWREEACGILAGPADSPERVTEWYSMHNAAEVPRYRYQFEPTEQVNLWVALDRRGMVPKIIYHSHLVGSADLSPNDVRGALDASIAHMVLALDGKRSALWWVRDEQAVPGAMTLVDDEDRSVCDTRLDTQGLVP